MNRAALWAALALVLVLPAAARAHGLGAEAKLKDGQVTVEAFYDDNTIAKGAKVVITGADGKTVAEGKTDEDGRWTFPVPPAGQYHIVVDGGSGHRKTVALTIPEAEKRSPDIRPDAPAEPSEPVTVSEGPTRSELTGPMRFVWAAIGLALIGSGTWALTRVLKIAKRPPPPDSRSKVRPLSPDPVPPQP